MRRFRVVLLALLCATGFSPLRVAVAQRTQTAEEIERTTQRRRAILEQQREAEARKAKAVAEQKERLNRLVAAGDPLPGLPFVMPGTIVVTRSRVIFMYVEPEIAVSLAKEERTGYYVWRWNMTDGASPFSLVFAADTAMRTSNFGDIVKSARVRRCNSIFETSAANCVNPVEAFVTRQGAGFRIEVTDSIIMNAMKAAQPKTVSARVFSPLGRSVPVIYKVMYTEPMAKAERE